MNRLNYIGLVGVTALVASIASVSQARGQGSPECARATAELANAQTQLANAETALYNAGPYCRGDLNCLAPYQNAVNQLLPVEQRAEEHRNRACGG